jgi:protein-tyrosine phosphatase
MVCLGNICRSPMADGHLRKKVKDLNFDVVVDSAGTANFHIGLAPDNRMIATGAKFGTPIDELRARQFKVADFDNFDDDTKKYFSKGFKDNDYVEDANKRKSDTGKYAVVTNEKGEFLYFNKNGEVSTSPKEGYKLAISTFPKVNEKKATKPTEKQLSLIGKTIEWYNKQVERLKSIRESKERKTLLIENILVNDNKTTNTPQDLKDYTDKVEGFNTINGRVFLKLKGLNKPVGLTRRKLTEQEATALANILLSKAKDKPFYEGLPESLNKLVDRFNYVKNFIVTGLDYYHNINGKKTWIDLSLGKDGGKPGVYVKIGSKDAEWRLLTHDETIRLFKQLDLNISSKIPLDSAFQVFSFDGKSFKEEPSVSYGNFLVQNFPAYQKITPEGKAEDSYIEFGAELGTTEAQFEDTRVEEEPVVSDIEAKKADIEKKRQEELEALPFDEEAKQRLEFAKTKGKERIKPIIKETEKLIIN